MNSLGLRISNAGGKKSKSSNNFMKLDVSTYFPHELLETNDAFKTFCDASTADEQLATLKPILAQEASSHESHGECNVQSVQFLVKIFFNAEAKHPVKCFLTRHITKNTFIQRQFSEILSQEITTYISIKPETYKEYIGVLTKLSACIENFPSGAAAVKILEVDLGQYLNGCLQCCVETLKTTQILSPTEKNEIYNLAHLALRIFLYIVQKISPENVQDLSSMFTSLLDTIRELLFDCDTPMDTKSVCGMLYLNMHILEYGQESWVDILQSNPTESSISSLLSNESSQLSLYSAIATVIPVGKLQSRIVEDEAALLVLCKRILAIGERSSSESIFILGVTRSLVQITKHVDKVTDSSVGLPLVANLLNFVWAHLEHYMDSVRHLTSQILGNVVKYCSKLDKEGDPEALNALFDALTSVLDPNRKSYYALLASLGCERGASKVLAQLPAAVRDVISAASRQHVQASATTTLEILLQKHVQEVDTKTIYSTWVEPILVHVNSNDLDSSVLNVLDGLLTKAVQLDHDLINYIIPHIKQTTNDLKCILMLLSVARKSGVKSSLEADSEQEWKDLIGYEVLEKAAVDAVEETRILSLSLIVESPKTTEVFSRGELNFILRFLNYNINVQSPNFRQLTLSMIKKFLKRLEDSYRVLKKQKDFTEDYYIQFLEELRSACFDSLIQGANYSRRVMALQTLLWCEQVQLDGYEKVWIEGYVEKLLLHLEDSYENNKALALEILNKCPTSLITSKKYSTSLDLEDILKQASSLKPTECVSAAYKLDLLRTKLTEKIVSDDSCNANVAARVTYTLLQKLQHTLLGQLAHCERSIASAAVNAPMYGVVHCMLHLVTRIDVDEISSDKQWSNLIGEMIEASLLVNAAVASVVNNSSPEGHLPMDMGVTDHGNTGGLLLEDGRQVTAQMVLLCAWRSVKEVSLLLGEISSRLSIAGEGGEEGTLTSEQLVRIGEHFTKLLAETKHRGAFEQAYVGFTKLLARLWRCVSPSLHCLPRSWLSALLAAIETGDSALSVTRRGAGLPFMIQALVTTELQVQGNPKCFHQCMTTLLRLARTPGAGAGQSETAIETRTHAINILRALFRNSSLDEAVACYVGEGLKVALEGFEGATWMERNSSTLLFSALMVRVFGVARSRDADNLCVRNRMTGRIFFLRYPQLYDFMLERNSSTLMVRVFGVARSRDADNLCVRNRMTGRIFFLRYPQLYDFMLDKLKEVSSSENSQLLRPSLYPILLLLARLYPSSLEGTVSNLKLCAYIPHVLSCARSSVLKTRQLAARAMAPLIQPDTYVNHFETLLGYISDKNIKRNYCHGILLQLTRLLATKPPGGCCPLFGVHVHTVDQIVRHVHDSYWLLEQPCYVLADEYVSVINLIVWRFPALIDKNTSECIQMHLEKLIFSRNFSQINSGRDICLSNALYLYFILITKKTDIVKIYDLTYKTLLHQSYDLYPQWSYEVVLTTLNFFLIIYEDFEIENMFEEHLDEILNRDGPKKYSKGAEISEQLHEYTHLLCEVIKWSQYFECQQKALKILSLQKNSEKYIVQSKMKKKGVRLTDEIVINTLIDCINNEHDNLTHIYLTCLSNYINSVLEGNKEAVVKPNLMLNVLRVMFACSRADNSEEMRAVVVGFIENTLEELFMMGLNGLSKEAKFEFKATIYAILVTTLEDDNEKLRQRTSNIILKLQDIFPNATAKAFKSTSFLNVDEAIFGANSSNLAFRKACKRESNLPVYPGYNTSDGSYHQFNITSPNEVHCGVISSRAAELLRELIAVNEEQSVAIFIVLALLDFKSEVVMNDEINDECRVFDQNERYNIYLEETVWTKEIAEQFEEIAHHTQKNPLHLIQTVLNNNVLRKPIHKLCNDNLVVFESMIKGENVDARTPVNPKIELFVNKLKEISCKNWQSQQN